MLLPKIFGRRGRFQGPQREFNPARITLFSRLNAAPFYSFRPAGCASITRQFPTPDRAEINGAARDLKTHQLFKSRFPRFLIGNRALSSEAPLAEASNVAGDVYLSRVELIKASLARRFDRTTENARQRLLQIAATSVIFSTVIGICICYRT